MVAVAVEAAAGFGGGALVGRDAMVGRGVTRDAATAAGEAGRGWATGLGEDAVLA